MVASVSVDRTPDDDVWGVNGELGMPSALFTWSGHDPRWPGHPHTLPHASKTEALLKLMDGAAN